MFFLHLLELLLSLQVPLLHLMQLFILGLHLLLLPADLKQRLHLRGEKEMFKSGRVRKEDTRV